MVKQISKEFHLLCTYPKLKRGWKCDGKELEFKVVEFSKPGTYQLRERSFKGESFSHFNCE